MFLCRAIGQSGEPHNVQTNQWGQRKVKGKKIPVNQPSRLTIEVRPSICIDSLPRSEAVTVAILAQGTPRGDAVAQPFFLVAEVQNIVTKPK